MWNESDTLVIGTHSNDPVSFSCHTGAANVCQRCFPIFAVKLTQRPSGERRGPDRSSFDHTTRFNCFVPTSRMSRCWIGGESDHNSNFLPSGENPRGIPHSWHSKVDQNGHQLSDFR